MAALSLRVAEPAAWNIGSMTFQTHYIGSGVRLCSLTAAHRTILNKSSMKSMREWTHDCMFAWSGQDRHPQPRRTDIEIGPVMSQSRTSRFCLRFCLFVNGVSRGIITVMRVCLSNSMRVVWHVANCSRKAILSMLQIED